MTGEKVCITKHPLNVSNAARADIIQMWTLAEHRCALNTHRKRTTPGGKAASQQAQEMDSEYPGLRACPGNYRLPRSRHFIGRVHCHPAPCKPLVVSAGVRRVVRFLVFRRDLSFCEAFQLFSRADHVP